MFMITKAIEPALWLNLTTKHKAKETICIKVAGGLLSFSATVVVWVDGEGLLPCVAVCLV
jgi:hypothetical protein